MRGPDIAAGRFDGTGDSIVNQAVFIFDAGSAEFLDILIQINAFENVLEFPVIDLGDGILGGKQQILPQIQGIVHTGAGKALDGFVKIVHAGDNAGIGEAVDKLAGLVAVLVGIDELHLAGLFDLHFRCTVHIAVGMAGQGNRLFPGFDQRLDAVDEDGRAEDRTVQNAADGPVRALIELLELILLHALGIGGDGGALDGDAVFLRGKRGVHGDLIVRLITGADVQVKILLLEIHKGLHKLALDLLPQDAGHFVPIHLHDGRCHLYFFHVSILLYPGVCFCCIVTQESGSFKIKSCE